MPSLVERYPSLPWVAPFAAFMLMLGIAPHLGLPLLAESLLRFLVPALVVALVSWPLIRTMRIERPWASVALGLGVFALWIVPDTLMPGWRTHWLFQNAILGRLTNSIPPSELTDPLVVMLRVLRAATVVPVVEELFWRGWLPRWLQDTRFERVPLGSFTTWTFIATALLFASEHGPYWEVGLLCGVIYNWWMMRTRSIGDLVVTHAVTNAALAAFVLLTRRYEYWM